MSSTLTACKHMPEFSPKVDSFFVLTYFVRIIAPHGSCGDAEPVPSAKATWSDPWHTMGIRPSAAAAKKEART